MPSGSKFFPARLKRFATCFALNQITPSGCVKIRPSPACYRRRKSGKSNPASVTHRQQLEHIIRAAAGITGASEFVIIGSQALLGQFPQAPDELLISIGADIFSLRDPADNDLIDGWCKCRSFGSDCPIRLCPPTGFKPASHDWTGWSMSAANNLPG
jgi:hypothetical protein